MRSRETFGSAVDHGISELSHEDSEPRTGLNGRTCAGSGHERGHHAARKSWAKMERPRLYKVILIHDDYTPRAFVVTVLETVFRMSEEEATRAMITAHRRGARGVAVLAKDIAERKAAEAT